MHNSPFDHNAGYSAQVTPAIQIMMIESEQKVLPVSNVNRPILRNAMALLPGKFVVSALVVAACL